MGGIFVIEFWLNALCIWTEEWMEYERMRGEGKGSVRHLSESKSRRVRTEERRGGDGGGQGFERGYKCSALAGAL